MTRPTVPLDSLRFIDDLQHRLIGTTGPYGVYAGPEAVALELVDGGSRAIDPCDARTLAALLMRAADEAERMRDEKKDP